MTYSQAMKHWHNHRKQRFTQPCGYAPMVATITPEPFTVRVAAYGPTSVLSEALYKALHAIRPAVPAHSRLPILSCVHLFTSEGCIYVEATDLQAPMREQVAARVETDLDLCVPWRGLHDWVQIGARSNDLLELTWDPETCILTARAPWCNYRAEFKGMDAQEFPPIKESDLAGERAPKPKTWAALCKQALKQGYTVLEILDGRKVPLLEAIRNPEYKPRRWYGWGDRPFVYGRTDRGDTFQLDEFPVPSIGGHNAEHPDCTVTWKLGTEPVTIGADQ